MKIPLVLLHGWGVNSQIWNPLLPHLQSTFEVHALDLPGYGFDSGFVGDFSMQHVANRVLEVAPPQAVWVAWSLGATIAMHAALQSPERFQKLQLVSATPCFMAAANWEFGMTAEPLASLANLFDVSYEKGLKKFLLLQSCKQSTARESVRSLSESILKLPCPSTETLRNSLNLLTESDLRSKVADLQVPTQVVTGKYDRIVAPSASHWLADAIPHARYVSLNAGHLPFLDAQDDYLNSLGSLVAGESR